jgi:tRNA A-37 threonylcarbamoyl transferase component Bud32
MIGMAELNELKQQIIDLAIHTAGSAQVTAIGLIDYPTRTENGKSIIEVVAVIKNFQPRLLSYLRILNGRNVIIFGVDQWVFERDIDRGFLGEAIASKLIFPYSTLQGESYLHRQEILLKKRLILESLENLSVGYPELVYHMQIKPQFFLYDVLLKRIRVFPLLAYELSSLLQGSVLKDEEKALESYNAALNQLETDHLITRIDGYVTVSKELAVQSRNPKVWLTNISKSAPRTLFTSFFGVFPQLLNILAQDTQAFLKTQKINLRLLQADLNPNCYTIDPQKYVSVPTAEGLVSLADNVNISGFAQKMFENEKPTSITFEPIGGVLNDIYLIKAQVKGTERKVLVKRFKDWSGFKWFPLTLWSLGARSFAVSGKARLAKECATSEFLRQKGFNVPKILHVSNSERLIFMDFIEGEDLSHHIKRLALEPETAKISTDLAKITAAGELLAKVHSYDMTLGDTKPENVMVSKDGTVYLLDFEQATQDGDKAWDIAEFLYYSGHYLQPLQSNAVAEAIAEAYIKGYIQGGGDMKHVKKAESAKYTRVFSVFTMPSIILAIANTIRKA